MKPKFFSAILAGAALLWALPPTAAEAAPGVSAQSAIVIEQSSGRTLFEKNAHARLPMASTTKIMTAILALEAADIAQTLTIPPEAAGVEGSSMYLEAGEQMTLEELLYGLMLASGNDAAVAIAERLGGQDAFVERMNQKAQEIGAADTHFTNPNGLPDENHYSTAADMARIAAYCLNNPDFARIVSAQSYQIAGAGKAYPRTLVNHNKLLRLCPGCVGVKTGYTKAAGRCLVSAARRQDMTLICVTLNAPDDWNDHMTLYDALFQDYTMKQILRAGVPLEEISVQTSETTALPAAAGADFSYPLAAGEDCVTQVTLGPPLDAPVEAGAACGTVAVRLGETTLAELPLTVTQSATRLPAAARMKEGIGGFCRRLLERLFPGS